MPAHKPAVCARHQASYLNDSDTRVRNATTLPSSTLMSIFVTSATRKSRSEPAAVCTAFRPASSHDVWLTPTTSPILSPAPACLFAMAILHGLDVCRPQPGMPMLPAPVGCGATSETKIADVFRRQLSVNRQPPSLSCRSGRRSPDERSEIRGQLLHASTQRTGNGSMAKSL